MALLDSVVLDEVFVVVIDEGRGQQPGQAVDRIESGSHLGIGRPLDRDDHPPFGAHGVNLDARHGGELLAEPFGLTQLGRDEDAGDIHARCL
jgi:hypothetical protein